MRNILLITAVALASVSSFAAPSQAGSYSYGYQPHCFVKKIKSYDFYGNVIIKHIKICK